MAQLPAGSTKQLPRGERARRFRSKPRLYVGQQRVEVLDGPRRVTIGVSTDPILTRGNVPAALRLTNPWSGQAF
jgi:hypothetical protein